jgi:NADH:ubiquinone reductase (non-electrogenic)
VRASCAPIYGVAHQHTDETEIQGEVSSTTIPFDYLIYAVGAETQTFGIPGVKEHACFMKEIQDAEKVSYHFEVRWRGSNRVPSSSVALWIVRYVIRKNFYRDLITVSGVESAGFPGQSEGEIKRLLHMVSTVPGSPIRLLIRLGCRWWRADWDRS